MDLNGFIMNRQYIYTLLCICLFAHTGYAQESDLQKRYRAMALEYNQDVRASEQYIGMSKELEKSATADYKPKLSGAANFNYTGNPMELSMELPFLDNPLRFQGRDVTYGASVSLTQPVYTGGRIRESVKMAQTETRFAENQSRAIKSDISYEADARYWNAVARKEITSIMQSYHLAVKELVVVVDDRVKAELISRNDLLMAEVKLNEVNYLLMQAQNNYEIARLNLNSFIGKRFDQVTPVDSLVPAIEAVHISVPEPENVLSNRAETHMALDKIDIQQSLLKIKDSQFLPRFHVGADGSYSSPGYNFASDLDPNYAVYAKISVPLFEWGKRKSEKRASGYRVDMARESYGKVVDNISLEMRSAYYNYTEAAAQVLLTQSSLFKAEENEKMAVDRYKEGLISIAEVLDAQLFHQTAQINYVQSRINAQLSLSELNRALGIYQF